MFASPHGGSFLLLLLLFFFTFCVWECASSLTVCIWSFLRLNRRNRLICVNMCARGYTYACEWVWVMMGYYTYEWGYKYASMRDGVLCYLQQWPLGLRVCPIFHLILAATLGDAQSIRQPVEISVAESRVSWADAMHGYAVRSSFKSKAYARHEYRM